MKTFYSQQYTRIFSHTASSINNKFKKKILFSIALHNNDCELIFIEKGMVQKLIAERYVKYLKYLFQIDSLYFFPHSTESCGCIKLYLYQGKNIRDFMVKVRCVLLAS